MRRGSWSVADPIAPRRQVASVAASLLISLTGAVADAAQLEATPENYRAAVARLRPGDTLLLTPGNYLSGLPLHGIVGNAGGRIVIRAADARQPPRFVARPGANTISIVDSAFVVVSDLILEGRGIAVDAVKAEGHSRFAHHITLERLQIRGHDSNQQVVAISTKCPAWAWIIRDSIIDGAGTGLYLGDSDGSDPFFSGLIEGNQIRNTIGYNLQIKHQAIRASAFGAPTTPQVTIIRRNQFAKGANSSRDAGARPNLLLGHFPLKGVGSKDRYLVYGNVFSGNPTEALFQAEGNVAFYNNLLVNPHGPAVNIQAHKHRPRWIAVFSNTILAAGTGIALTDGEPGYEQRVSGNAVFSDQPFRGYISGPNVVASLGTMPRYLAGQRSDVQAIDARPVEGQLLGAPRLPADLAMLPEATLDLNGRKRSAPVFGACLPTPPSCPQ